MPLVRVFTHVRTCRPCRWWSLTLLTLLTLLSLGPLASLLLGQRAPVVRRFPADTFWQPRWVVGGDSTADTFVEPRHVIASGPLVVVLDDGTREVRGFDARTGTARFVLRPTGDGPGEFRRPALVAPTPSGFVLLDHANARVTAFDRRGQRLWDAVLPDVFSIAGLCMPTDTTIIASYRRRANGLVEYDQHGRQLATRDIPWRAWLPNAPSFAYAQAVASAGVGPCALAPVFGSEWAVFDARKAQVFPLHEPGPQPAVAVRERVLSRSLTTVTVQSQESSDSPQATRGIAVQGDTVMIYAAHTADAPLRLLDYHAASTGRYLFSRRLPFPVNGFTVGEDGTVYVTRITPTVQSVLALRPATLRAGGNSARPARPGPGRPPASR